MPRSLWSGTLSFGLVNIPVSLITAKEEPSLSFHMLDKRDFGRIGYRTINKKTGKEIGRDQIVKGYEYEKNRFVVITDEDFERANPRATRTIEIEDFVSMDDLDPLLLEKPYYLIPQKHGEKGYLLLRKVMEETNKVAIGRFVLRQKQRLVAIIARGEYLVLEVLRYAREVLSANELDVVHDKVKNVKVSPKELNMAEALVKGMSTKWNADKYHDTYTEDVLKMIENKVKHGGAVESEEVPRAPAAPRGNVVDLMPLLKKSLQRTAAGASADRPKEKRKTAKKHRAAHHAKPARRGSSRHTHLH